MDKSEMSLKSPHKANFSQTISVKSCVNLQFNTFIHFEGKIRRNLI